jgi:hypothetical protein
MVGDETCIFAGGKVPYLIRLRGEQYLLVGKVWIPGVMEGEAVGSPGFELRDIALILSTVCRRNPSSILRP